MADGGHDGPEAADERPLILTLRLDAVRQQTFDSLRQAHFPSARNHLAAHVTLFHHLPASEMQGIVTLLRESTADMPAPTVSIDGVISLGRGVAFRLGSPEAVALRRDLAGRLKPHLTPQDQSFGRLHVTVQNKVTADAAKTLLARLQAGFIPESFRSPGLDLWRYLGGPWEHLAPFDFRED